MLNNKFYKKNNKSFFNHFLSERRYQERCGGKKITKPTHDTKSNGGFVLLIAVLLASVFGIVGASIFTISIKELILSSGGKESQYAFYAADSGIECALYWDLKYSTFATSTLSVEPSNVYCSDQDVTTLSGWEWKTNIDGQPTTANQGGTVFGFDLYPDDPARDGCAIVSVFKERVSGDTFSTKIESRGYNTCDVNNPRRVERAIRVDY